MADLAAKRSRLILNDRQLVEICLPVMLLAMALHDRKRNAETVARQSKPLVQRQSAIHPMVEQRSVGKLVSSPKPPEAGAQRARLYTSLTAGHHNSRMQLTLDDTHSRQ